MIEVLLCERLSFEYFSILLRVIERSNQKASLLRLVGHWLGGVELSQQSALLAELTHLNVSCCVVSKELVLVLGILLHVVFHLSVFKEHPLSRSLEELGLLSKQNFLIIGVVEDVGVLGPSALESSSVLMGETKSVRPHDCYDVSDGEAHSLHLGNNVVVALSGVRKPVMRSYLCALFSILSAHPKEHDWASAVLNGSVASKLNQI